MEMREPPAAVVDFRGLSRVLTRRRKVIAVTTATCVVIALAVALLLTPRYVSQVRILIDPRGLQILPNDISPAVPSGEAAFAILESQVQVLTSTEVLQKVIAKLKLEDDPEFSVAASAPVAGTAAPPADMDPRTWAALRNLRKHIDVRRPDRTFVIDLSVRTSSAEKSKRIADAIAQAYLDVQAQAQAETATRTASALEGRLNDLRQRLSEAEKNAENYRTGNNLVGTEGKLLSDQQLTDLTNQLSAQRIRAAELEARMGAVRKRNIDEVPLDTISEALQSATIADLRSRYAEAKKVEADSMVSLGPRHPAVVTAQAQVRQIRDLINAELGRIGRSLDTEYKRTMAAETELSRQIAQAKQVSASSRPQVLKLRDLENEVAARRAVYETVQRRAKEIREDGMLDRTNVRIISPATLPLREYVVPRALLLAGALVFGLLAGVFLAILLNQFDDTAWQPDDLFSRTGLFNLGTARRRDVLAASMGEEVTSPDLREIRQFPNLLRMALQKSPGAVLVLSAGDPASSAAFAVAIARQAVRETASVLMIDGTRATKLVTKQFGLSDKAGFAEAKTDAVPPQVIEVATPSGVHVVPAGAAAVDDPGRWGGDATDAMRRLWSKYDMTVIDGGSIDRQDYMQTLDLAGIVVIVVDAGQSSCESIVRSLPALNPRQTRLVATVLQTA